MGRKVHWRVVVLVVMAIRQRQSPRTTVEGIEDIRKAQRAFLSHHWKRSKKHEGWSKLEHRVYYRGGKKNRRWLRMTAGIFFGPFCEFEVTRKAPY